MYFSIAALEDPVRSFNALIAYTTISLYLGCKEATLTLTVFLAGEDIIIRIIFKRIDVKYY